MHIVGHDHRRRQLEQFRAELYRCLGKWADALFELATRRCARRRRWDRCPRSAWSRCSAAPTAASTRDSPSGEIDGERLSRLLVEHRPEHGPLVFAVDASTWERCDAECSPERGFYHSASKHSAGQPIVAGWSFQWISQLSWDPDSWTAPMDTMRIAPGQDATEATLGQVRRLLRLLPATTSRSRCSSSTPATTRSPSPKA